MAKHIREKRFEIDFKYLQEFAFGFPVEPLAIDKEALIDLFKLPEINELKYTKSEYLYLLESFDKLCSMLCMLINENK